MGSLKTINYFSHGERFGWEIHRAMAISGCNRDIDNLKMVALDNQKCAFELMHNNYVLLAYLFPYSFMHENFVSDNNTHTLKNIK